MSAHGLIAGTLAAAALLGWSDIWTSEPAAEGDVKLAWHMVYVAVWACVFTVLFFAWTLQ